MGNVSIRVTIQTDKGKWKRRNDEYVSCKIPDQTNLDVYGSIVILADGQGGNINSNLCAKISAESCIEFYYQENSDFAVEERLRNSFHKVHLLIKEKAEFFHTPGMICSLSAVVVIGNSIWTAHVGSNQVFEITAKKELLLLTKTTETMIGQTGEISVEIQTKSVESGSRILALTDGITAELSNDLIAKTCTLPSSEQISSQLIHLANDFGGEDNMTAVIVDMGKFSKKTIPIVEKKEPSKRKMQSKPKQTQTKHSSRFLNWIFLILLIFLFLFLTMKYYSPLMRYLFRGMDDPVNETLVLLPDKPPTIIESPEASLMVIVNPRIVTVFLYEGEVALSEKQKDPYFFSQSTPSLIKGLKKGSYTLIVGANGYEPYRQVIVIRESDLNKEIPVTLLLKPIDVISTNNPNEKPSKPVITPEPTKPPESNLSTICDLIIQSDPSGAKIFINGSSIGLVTPNVYRIKPGSYLVQIIKEGYESSSRSVVLTSDSNKQTIFFTLKAKLVLLSVNSQPGGAKIYLNNAYTGKNTPATLSLTPGTYTIMAGKAGFDEQAITIIITPGESPKPILFTLKRKPSPNQRIDFLGNMYES